MLAVGLIVLAIAIFGRFVGAYSGARANRQGHWMRCRRVADYPEQAIVERAEGGADLVVMASGRKPSTHRAFFGHRIDYVISHATCPVAVVAASSTGGVKK